MNGYTEIEARKIISACENYKLAVSESKQAYNEYVQKLKDTKVSYLFFSRSRYDELRYPLFSVLLAGHLSVICAALKECKEAVLSLTDSVDVNKIINQALISEGSVLCDTGLSDFVERWSSKQCK